jgi:predicted MFS family arabinose efflux permease
MNRTLPLLAAANFAAASAGMIIAGVLQLIATDLQWSPAQAGRLITWYALGFAVGAPLLGALLGSWCRKQVVILGLSLVCAGSVASVLAARSPWLELARLVVACGAAMTIPSVAAIATHLFPAERARALAAVLLGMTLAIVAGIPIGTFAAGVWGWRAPLAGAAALAAIAGLLIKIYLPGGIVVPPVPLRAWRALLSDSRTYALLALPLLMVAATFSVYGYIAPFVRTMVGIDARGLSWLLLWYGLVSLAANGMLGALGRRVGPERLLVLSMIGLVFTLGLTRFTDARLGLLVGLFAIWAASSVFFGTLQQARLVESAPTAGTALLALNNSATFAGQGLGVSIGGIVVSQSGVQALPWAGAGLALLALLLFGLTRHVRLV